MKNDAYQKELADRKARQHLLDDIVRTATDSVVAALRHERPQIESHFFYGASAIHPRHLVTWYLFKTDVELAEAKANGLTGRIETRTRDALRVGGYPPDWVSAIMVSFTTDEDIEREIGKGGNRWDYFK